MKLGAYHTLELELQRAFTLHKVGRASSGGMSLARGQECTARARGLSCSSARSRRPGCPGLGGGPAVAVRSFAHAQERDFGARAACAPLGCASAPLASSVCALRPRPALSPALRPQDEWDAVDVERVRTACDPAASADLAVVLITVGGCAGGWAGVRVPA